MSLANLKKGSSLDKLKKAVEQSSGGNGGGGKGADDRFWQPEVDTAGNGYAVIRFLDTPAVDGEDGLPWVQIWNHGFQGPGGWYIENSLTTLGKADPVGELNTQLWNSGIEANKEIARKQKRKLTYIANVLVITDAKRPQNEGKVFLYKFGKKIFEKVKNKLEPEFQDETPLNPFDFWKGANFKIKIRNQDGYRNYDRSEFEAASVLFEGDDDKIEKVWKNAYSLKEFVDPKNFKSYDELKAKLNKVLGAGGAAAASAKKIDDEETYSPPVRSAPAKKATAETTNLSDDDDMSYFEQLAAE
jgi:gp32 DNA binding protein like